MRMLSSTSPEGSWKKVGLQQADAPADAS